MFEIFQKVSANCGSSDFFLENVLIFKEKADFTSQNGCRLS
jgi:hypothetical protein